MFGSIYLFSLLVQVLVTWSQETSEFLFGTLEKNNGSAGFWHYRMGLGGLMFGTMPPNGCKCHRDPVLPEEVVCACRGPRVNEFRANLTRGVTRLSLESVSITVLKAGVLQIYKDSLRDLVLDRVKELAEIEDRAFYGLHLLRTISIKQAPKLRHIQDAVFNCHLPNLKIIRIIQSGLETIPNLEYVETKSIIYMVDLDNNKIKHLPTGSVKMKTEMLNLDFNLIQKIESKAFDGSEIAKLSLKGNSHLRIIDENAFFGLKNVRTLDLSETSISHLPIKGLEELEVLRLSEVYDLKVFPSVYHFKYIKEAHLTYPYHCCAFRFPATHDPEEFSKYLAFKENMEKTYCKQNPTTRPATKAEEDLVVDSKFGRRHGRDIQITQNSMNLINEDSDNRRQDYDHKRTAIITYPKERHQMHKNNLHTMRSRMIKQLDESVTENAVYPNNPKEEFYDLAYEEDKKHSVSISEWSGVSNSGNYDDSKRNSVSVPEWGSIPNTVDNEDGNRNSISASEWGVITNSRNHEGKGNSVSAPGWDAIPNSRNHEGKGNFVSAPEWGAIPNSANSEDESKRNSASSSEWAIIPNSGNYDEIKKNSVSVSQWGKISKSGKTYLYPEMWFNVSKSDDFFGNELPTIRKNPSVGKNTPVNPFEGIFHGTTVSVISEVELEAFCGQLAKNYRDVECFPAPDAFNPCEDVMGNMLLRVVVWIVVFTSLMGNVAVMVVLMSTGAFSSVSKFLMCNLAFGDFCMGCYLLMIAVMDVHSMGTYFNYAIDWQHGYGCEMAGFLTVFATELSIFTLTVISVERWYAITSAINLNKRLKLRRAANIMSTGWFFSLTMAFLPLVNVNGYSRTSICLPMKNQHVRDVVYLMVLIITNSLAFLFIFFCYGNMYVSVIRHQSKATANDMAVAKRMAMLVITDFLCWAPVAFFAATAVAGYPLIDVTNSKILLVFFYPLNSCANPFLYAIFTTQYRRDFLILLRRCDCFKQWTRGEKQGNTSCNVPPMQFTTGNRYWNQTNSYSSQMSTDNSMKVLRPSDLSSQPEKLSNSGWEDPDVEDVIQLSSNVCNNKESSSSEDSDRCCKNYSSSSHSRGSPHPVKNRFVYPEKQYYNLGEINNTSCI